MTSPLSPPSTQGFHHHAIKVRDLARAQAFYGGVLGLVEEKRWQHPPGASQQGLRSVWLRVNPASPTPFLALEQHEEPAIAERVPPTAEPGHFLLALAIRVEEREAWRAHLAAAGCPVTHETPFTLYVVDPEGNRLGLSHHPVAAPTR